MALDQMKMLMQLKKAQKELSNELVEVEAGDGAVVVQINGELKVKSVKFNKDLIGDDFAKLEKWVMAALADGMKEAQEMAAEKMKPFMGGLGLGNLGQ
jgi:DNA-binding YbaB/EbfC family protein